MTFNWFSIFNLNEFLALELPSKSYLVVLEGIGQKDLLVVRGNEVSFVYEDVILPVRFLGDNPFIREGEASTYAVFVDTDSVVWLGILAT